MRLSVFDLSGKEKSTVELSSDIFGMKENPSLLAQYMRVYMTNQRQGNASTKTRGEVRGSTRKIYRQKGTGRARHGSKYASLFVGGGITAGPRPKEFSLKMNKKQKRKALFQALSIQYKNDKAIGLAAISLKTEPKTKIIAQFLKKLDAEDKKILFVLPEMTHDNFVQAARNIENVKLTDAFSINPYLILASEKIIFVGESIERINKHFLKKDEN